MKRITAKGVAVMRPKIGRGYEVIGVGFDVLGAIRDANWRDNECRVPDARYLDERPDWITVEAKITVSIDPDAITAGVAKHARFHADRASRRSGGAG